MSIELAAIKEVVGLIAEGPAGFGMNREATGQPHVVGDTIVTEFKLNGQEAALKQHRTGVNKRISDVMDRADQRAAASQAQYGKLLGRTGAGAAMARRAGLRTLAPSMASTMGNASPAPPRLVHPRQMHKLRQSFSVAEKAFMARDRQLKGLQPTKTLTVSLSMLSPAERKKMVEAAIQRGDATSPVVGALPSANAKKKRQWAMINPELIPSGYAMD